VQDWFWWTTKGEFVFNKNYPDAKGMIDDLHRNNFHLMISVWPYFDPGTAELTPTWTSAAISSIAPRCARTIRRAWRFTTPPTRRARLLLEPDG
jgi:hypothetical protein